MINLRIKWPTRYEVMTGAKGLKSALMLRRRWFGWFWQDCMMVENLIREKQSEMNKAYDVFAKHEEEYRALLREANRAQESVDNARDCGIGKGPIFYQKMPWRRKEMHKLMPEQDTRWERFMKVLKGRAKSGAMEDFKVPGGGKVTRIDEALVVEDTGSGMPIVHEGAESGIVEYNTDYTESGNHRKKNNNGNNNQGNNNSGHVQR